MVTHTITIMIGEDYLDELNKRLVQYEIGRTELAREMGVHPSHISRMFNKRALPTLPTVKKIESAIVRIRERREKR